jgi:NAD(P)H-dependent FMN reductase
LHRERRCRSATQPGLAVVARHEDTRSIRIGSPEYAHGIAGTIKNALDWLVSFEPFADKPVAVLNASPRAHHADAALRAVLRTMAAVIVEPASITIPLLGAKLDENGMVSSPSIAAAIQESLAALYEAVALWRADGAVRQRSG